MNTCPTELHSYICLLACTDDGFTSTSLAHVSKYFSNVARPFRYQSIAVSGIDQVLQLSARLENIPQHMRCIRHLFISDSSSSSSSSSSHKIDGQHSKRPSNLGRQSIIRTLRLASPTVETLTLYTSCPPTSTSLIAGLFSIVFPRLTELTVVGYYPFPHVPNSMPRLERLHLRGNRNPHGLLHIDNLRLACPKLTHLRISGLSMAISFVEELAEALSCKEDHDHDHDHDHNHHHNHNHSDDQPSSVFTARLPPRLKSLVVQPGPAPTFHGRLGVYDLKDQAMLERLSTLSRPQTSTIAAKLVLLERDTINDGSSNIARWEWSDRLNGGEGCWSRD